MMQLPMMARSDIVLTLRDHDDDDRDDDVIVMIFERSLFVFLVTVVS
jgi:hypothetical protein